MIAPDAECNKLLGTIMSARRHGRREWKSLALVILHDHCTSSFTVNKTKLNLLMMQQNAAVGDGICCFDLCFLSSQLKF